MSHCRKTRVFLETIHPSRHPFAQSCLWIMVDFLHTESHSHSNQAEQPVHSKLWTNPVLGKRKRGSLITSLAPSTLSPERVDAVSISVSKELGWRLLSEDPMALYTSHSWLQSWPQPLPPNTACLFSCKSINFNSKSMRDNGNLCGHLAKPLHFAGGKLRGSRGGTFQGRQSDPGRRARGPRSDALPPSYWPCWLHEPQAVNLIAPG